MKILLDNCVDKNLTQAIGFAEATHCADIGWERLLNGELVRAASAEFDALITVDKNMEFQTSLRGLTLVVIVLDTPKSKLSELTPLLTLTHETILGAAPGTFTRIRG